MTPLETLRALEKPGKGVTSFDFKISGDGIVADTARLSAYIRRLEAVAEAARKDVRTEELLDALNALDSQEPK